MRFWTVTLLSLIALLACLPTEPCACPPALGLGTVFGQVTDETGAPVADIPIEVTAYRDACGALENPLIDVEARRTDDAGRYRYELRTIVPSQQGCIRVAALSAERDTLASADAELRFVSSHGGDRPDSVQVDLRVP